MDGPQAWEDEGNDDVPWPQRLFDSIWVLAFLAVVFFFLSYVVWGLIDLLSIGPGV